MKNIAIILASGLGFRSGSDIPKQFIKIAGKEVIEHTLDIFQSHALIDEIIVVTNEIYIEKIEKLKEKYSKIIAVTKGGATRRESSYQGLITIKEPNANVLIHDAVRPFLSNKIIDDCICALENYCAVDVAINSADTIIKVNDKNFIEDIPNRAYLKRGQTPQAFKLDVILHAHKLAQQDNIEVTDDCGLILKYKLCDIYVVSGDDFNMKITYPIDIALADKLFQLKTYDVNNCDFKKLENKVAVIFGGTSGIGLEIANIIKTYGGLSYCASRRTNIDISDFKSVQDYLKSIYQKEKRIDYVINTAGVLNLGSLNDRNIDDIKNEININYLGAINVAKASFEYLKQSHGHLQFFSSSSYTRGRANYSIYSSSKAAVVNFSQALSSEWAQYNIKVNTINPQRTATKMRFDNFKDEPAATLLTPQHVAQKSIETLLSDITGQIINVRIDENNLSINIINSAR